MCLRGARSPLPPPPFLRGVVVRFACAFITVVNHLCQRCLQFFELASAHSQGQACSLRAFDTHNPNSPCPKTKLHKIGADTVPSPVCPSVVPCLPSLVSRPSSPLSRPSSPVPRLPSLVSRVSTLVSRPSRLPSLVSRPSSPLFSRLSSLIPHFSLVSLVSSL
jgi:hypothetical protein